MTRILLILVFIPTVLFGDEIPLTKDETILKMYNLSSDIWKGSPSSMKYSPACSDLNKVYKEEGYRCSSSDASEPEGLNKPTNYQDILDFISFKTDVNGKAINRLVTSTTCSKPVKMSKDDKGKLVLADLSPATINKVNGYDLNTTAGLNALSGDLWKRYVKFFRTYKCAPNTGAMAKNSITGKVIFTPAFVDTKDDVSRLFLDEYIPNEKYGELVKNSSTPNDTFINEWYKNSILGHFYADVLSLSWECNKMASPNVSCPPIELSSVFKNNEWEFKDDFWNVLEFADTNGKLVAKDKKNQMGLDCLHKALKMGNLEINKINIKTSSSSLSNGSILCSKDFIGLSRRRALNMQEVVKKAFAEKGYKGFLPNTKFLLDFYGSNKDGSSGPCAHVVKDGKMTDAMVGLEDSLLQKYRSAELLVRFGPAAGRTTSTTPAPTFKEGYIVLNSRFVYFSCQAGGVPTGNVPSSLFD